METTAHTQTGRDRPKPLYPKPFERLLIPQQQFESGPTSFAPQGCEFYPDLDIQHYWNQLSEEKKAELCTGARRLVNRARQNQDVDFSEFGWEADAWHDVFGPIRDDDALRIDKRPYEYVERDEEGKVFVKRKIPDATMGLRCYTDLEFKRGYPRTAFDYKGDHAAIQPHEALSKRRIIGQMHNRECGLIVDGIWGESTIVFPFAVYEAKKPSGTIEEAEDQVYHALRTYLAMLDDLGRDPTNTSKYQSKESERCQLFGFVSCGSYWFVYCAWHWLSNVYVETIWEGDVGDLNSAYALVSIMDQIHDYGATQHRGFIIKHLNPWLEYSEDCGMARFPQPCGGDSLSCIENDTKKRQALHPGWRRIKEISKQYRNTKATLASEYKRGIKVEKNTDDEANNLGHNSRFRAKRGRGRPRKRAREYGPENRCGRSRKN